MARRSIIRRHLKFLKTKTKISFIFKRLKCSRLYVCSSPVAQDSTAHVIFHNFMNITLFELEQIQSRAFLSSKYSDIL